MAITEECEIKCKHNKPAKEEFVEGRNQLDYPQAT